MVKKIYIFILVVMLGCWGVQSCTDPGLTPDSGIENGDGGDNPGGGTGGDNGDNPGGNEPNPGGDNPGGDNPGGSEPDPGGDNPGGDNPGGDNPGGNDPTNPQIEVLDPGVTPSEQTYTPGYPELEHEVSYNDFYNPVQDDLDDYGNVDYVCSQGNGTAWPIITSDGYIRLYQGSSSSKGGSYIRFRSKNGATLQHITVGSATSTSVAYYFDRRPSTQSPSTNIAQGSTFSLECPQGCTEVCLICTGTDQAHRWELNYVALKYKGGFVESDFYQAPAEYGPLVKVSMPFVENFEKDFPTTDKPSYFKYGLTAGRQNLQWSTWYGSFSWQKALEGRQSAQLRVYQEEQDYEKSQFGHLKMEYFIKDLKKVSFKFYYSEFWNKATISYCEFGSTEYKGAQQISLSSYSERQTIRNFEYVLDEGRAHDAKIIIEIDPVTGHPSRDHYDFYFDEFRFE